MRRSLLLSSVGLIGGLLGSSTPAMADEATKTKGAKTPLPAPSGNDHTVSWNAAYALINARDGACSKHLRTCIRDDHEAVVNDPGYPDCGRYLGDLFGGSSSVPGATLQHRQWFQFLRARQRRRELLDQQQRSLQLLTPQRCVRPSVGPQTLANHRRQRLTRQLQPTWSQQNLDLLGFAGHQTIDQLISRSQLQPVTGQT